MSVAQAIINGMTTAANLPCVAPSGTAHCPLGRVRIGVFFDGTSNSMYKDWPNGEADSPTHKWGNDNGPSNIAKLWKLFRDQPPVQKRVYHHGVGADSTIPLQKKHPELAQDKPTAETYWDWQGGAFGAGGKARVQWGMKQCADFFSRKPNDLATEKLIDTFGFSRGAAIARDFVNTVLTQRIDNLNEKHGTRLKMVGAGFGTTYVEVPVYRPHVHVFHEFLGVFDTVASFGAGGPAWADSAAGYNFFIDHKQVRRTVHMVAEDEVRGNFPLTSLFQEPHGHPVKQPANMKEIWYPGCHSDVGGGYLHILGKDAVPARTERRAMRGGVVNITIPAKPAVPLKKPDLAHIPLHDMHQAAVKGSVPLNPIPGGKLWDIPGDLQRDYDGYDGFRAKKKYAQVPGGGVYLQSWPSETYRAMRAERAQNPSFHTLDVNYGHDSRWSIDRLYDRQQRTVHYMAPQKG